jgi:thiamine-phosphate pyrophosphorylase
MDRSSDKSWPSSQFGGNLSARERLASLRIIDANANRAAEGLRVVEDYCRFFLNDGFLSRQHKELRHELSELLAVLPSTLLAVARDTSGDVGIEITTVQEGRRLSMRSVALASSKRVEQALRIIEEQSKLLGLRQASQFEQLRYRAYTLSKAWTLTEDSQQRLAAAHLYVLVDGCTDEAAFVTIVESLLRARVDVIQLRDKALDDRALVIRARLLRALIPKDSETLFIVNDRPDLAILAGADGVHVGQEELPVRDIRKVVGPEMIVGVSTHTIPQVRQAVFEGANYIGCGPTFPSPTKEFEAFPGLEFLRQVAGECSLPAFAIGGITQSNLSEVLATGFTRVAVSSSITTATNAEEEARLMLQKLHANCE